MDMITLLQRDLARVSASIEDVKLTLAEHLLRCDLRACMWRDTRSVNNHAQSMLLTQREVVEDFMSRKEDYVSGGRCRLAAAEAWEFFDRTTNMQPELVSGVLYATSGDMVVTKDGITPASDHGISPAMRRFRLTDSCIWVADDSTQHDVKNVHGMRHRVTMVTTADGNRVAVDWGVAQFRHLPDDIRLYI